MKQKHDIFIMCVIILLFSLMGCRKHYFKEDRKFEIKFHGTLNSYCEGRIEDYDYVPDARFYCYSVSDEGILMVYEETNYASFMHKDGQEYRGALCKGEASKTSNCKESYILGASKLKYKLSKFRFVLTGDAVVEKSEYNCSVGVNTFNSEFLVGTYTLFPAKNE